jgi:DNA-binding NarL/FixJ family response regulator
MVQVASDPRVLTRRTKKARSMERNEIDMTGEESHMGPIRIIVADDYDLIRAGYLLVIEGNPDIELVGEATTGEEAQYLCEALQPAILLLDLGMPGQTATTTLTNLRLQGVPTRTIIVTAHRDKAWCRRLVDLGIRGYILKEDAISGLAQAICVVAAGGTWFSPAILPYLCGTSNDESGDQLTQREVAILELLAVGQRNAEIAAHLSITERTVEFHLRNLFSKLQVRSRTEAICQAQRRGLLLPDLARPLPLLEH